MKEEEEELEEEEIEEGIEELFCGTNIVAFAFSFLFLNKILLLSILFLSVLLSLLC